MQGFSKTDWEEIYFYHEFKRRDGRGWLADDESIASATVTTVPTGLTITNVAPYGLTKVVYQVSGGTSGTKYVADIKIITDKGQKFEDKAQITVL